MAVPHRLLHRLPVFSPGRSSLHRHLLLWLVLPQLVLWLAAAVVSYNVALRYANLANDRSLSLSSRALARQVKPVGSGLYVDFPRAAKDIIETDPDDRVYYMVSTPPGEFILGNLKLPLPPADEPTPIGQPVFYDARIDTAEGVTAVRVAAITLNWGEPDQPQRMLVQVAKSRVSREALARQLLFDTALPLSLLMAAMWTLVWIGIRTGLAPLARLRDAVSGRAANDLAPIELDSAPEEVRDLAGAMNALLAAVHENVMNQRRFISDAAHQLRTPLAGLKGQTELALKETTDPALRTRLERVHESATRSAHLVTQLLTLARAEPESSAALGRVCFDLRRLVHELTAELVPRALKAGIDLGMDDSATADDVALPVLGQPLLVREALINLIDNAIRYAGRGAEVTVRCLGPDHGVILVEVDDNGPGIAPAMAQQVFERFFRGTTEGSGCGLGLAIVKEIVERHQGSVTLSALRPHGVRMQIRLPLAQQPLKSPGPAGRTTGGGSGAIET
ncbi:histidine kinase [Leptothrix cholodnii SP-6]|uniref:histidine kinase n=1 Tax=Leptothrix cholodnii (strain ATCC 51168 / LMG 8142 / SP-6) TaxID=395495 RepID=B1XY62_LEPCP|nr:sensor histidine kinase [Leptothrix cholodnii]ACB33963.1 histidine kinase [Leptothrix cholodnii SP-6]